MLMATLRDAIHSGSVVDVLPNLIREQPAAMLLSDEQNLLECRHRFPYCRTRFASAQSRQHLGVIGKVGAMTLDVVAKRGERVQHLAHFGGGLPRGSRVHRMLLPFPLMQVFAVQAHGSMP